MSCGTCGVPFADNLSPTRTILSSWNVNLTHVINEGMVPLPLPGGEREQQDNLPPQPLPPPPQPEPGNISVTEALATIFEIPPLTNQKGQQGPCCGPILGQVFVTHPTTTIPSIPIPPPAADETDEPDLSSKNIKDGEEDLLKTSDEADLLKINDVGEADDLSASKTNDEISLCFECAESLTILYNSYKEFTTQVIKLNSEVAKKLQLLDDLRKIEQGNGLQEIGLATVEITTNSDQEEIVESCVSPPPPPPPPSQKSKRKRPLPTLIKKKDKQPAVEVKEELVSDPECDLADFDDFDNGPFTPLGIQPDKNAGDEGVEIKQEDDEKGWRLRKRTGAKLYTEPEEEDFEDEDGVTAIDPSAVLQKLEVDWQEDDQDVDMEVLESNMSSSDSDFTGSGSASDSDEDFCLTPVKTAKKAPTRRPTRTRRTRRKRRNDNTAPAKKTSSGKFQCPECDAIFAHRKSYTRHYKSHTEFANSVQCPTCDKKFTREDHLKVHRRKIHGEDIPVKNVALFKTVKEHSLKKADCPVCEETLLKRDLRAHLETHNDPKPWKCTECPEAFGSKRSQTRHIATVHDQQREKAKSICLVCFKELRSEYHLQRHQTTVHHVRTDKSTIVNPVTLDALDDEVNLDTLNCDLCGKHYTTKKKLKEHLIVHGIGEKFKCGICGTEFNHKKSHQRHLMKHSEAAMYKCPEEECKKKFIRKDNLAAHIRDVHKLEVNYSDLLPEGGVEALAPPEPRRPKPKKIPCPDCNKLVVRGNMKLHMVKHTGEKTHLCDICGRSFGLHTSLVTHRKYTHQLVAPLKCNLCGKICRRPKDFRAHNRLHELGDERPFICEICGKTFRHEKNLKSHHAVHEASKEYPCKVCGAIFSRTDNLRAHVRVIHEGKPARRRKPKQTVTHDANLIPSLAQHPSTPRQMSAAFLTHARRGALRDPIPRDPRDDMSMSSIASSETSSPPIMPGGQGQGQIYPHPHRLPSHHLPIPNIQYHSGAYSAMSTEYPPHSLLHL